MIARVRTRTGAALHLFGRVARGDFTEGLRALDTAERSSIDVADALVRIESGGFGVCARCLEPIPVARLELRPAGRYCVSCTR
mgnify:CR=1 FL=1